MENKDQNEIKENNINEDVNETGIEPDNVTREINLDELYDGAINNTTIIDPVTNDEVLLSEKKPNFTLIGVALAVLVLLVLYYVNNKTQFGGTVKEVEPKTTTAPVIEETIQNKNGTLTCSYSSHSDSDTQTVTYTANYSENLITDSTFNYAAISSNDVTSVVVADLKSQYENYYINNASLTGSSVTFEKDDKGFTFNVVTNYETAEFDRIIMHDGQTILYVKPHKGDTYDAMLISYTEKGFTCSLSEKN